MNDTLAGQPDLACLYRVAGGQLGHFTTAQARECGFAGNLLTYHVRSGRFLRIHRGVYRLRDYPLSPREEVMAAWLALGKERSTVSHESALDLLDLGEEIPDQVHLLLPRTHRRPSELPGVRIHTTTRPLRPGDIANRDGMRVTSPVRTILDVAETGLAPDRVERVTVEALRTGQMTEDQLARDAEQRNRRVRKLVAELLSAAHV